MSYPDVVIACIEHKVSLKHSEQLRQRWWSTIIIWRIIPWWLTDLLIQSFKLFSLWQSQHAVCHCQESGKTATQLLQCLTKWNLQYRPVRREERGCYSSSLQLMYMLSFLTLVSDGRLQWPRLEKFLTLLLKSDVNLFNHLVRKADVAGCCSAGSVLRWHEVAPYSVSLICIVWSCFYVKLMQIN